MTKSPFKKTNINSVFIMCLAFFIAGCKEMLPVPQMSQNNTEIKSALAAPSNITATHGLKRKIRLTWTGTSSAKCYYIYSASTPFDEYVQINETTNDNTYIELAVPSGYSGYFKVAAVNGLGEVSDKSLAVYGTSLATPQITSIQEDQTSATVYWFMENLNRKTYLDDIHFTAICYDSKSNEVGRKTLAGTTETFCTFDGLSSGTKYFYEVEAYLGSDGDSIEKSLKLDSETVVSLTPAVPKFTVSEGTRDDRIDINITLPPMVKILVESGSGGANQASYEDRPLYFKISKLNDSTGEYDELVKYIPFNYNGESPIKEIGKDSEEFNNYKEGDVITYSDFVEPNKVERGKKYTYKVFACTDNYYNSKGERLSPVSDDKKTTAQTGWAASVPRIFSSSIEYDYEESETETEAGTVTVKTKIAARLEITTAWDSIGKENEYVYMLLQNHKTLESATGDGTDSFIAKQDGSCYFDTLEEIKSVPLTFDLKTNPESVRGYYRYSFYIVPKSVKSEVSDPNQNVDTIKEKSLTHIDDISSKLISDGDVDIVPNIKVEDGYKDKVIIKWEAKDNVNYKLVRYTLDNEGSIDNSITAVSVDSDKLTGGTYTDNEIESGKAYSYTVYASNDQIFDVPSNTVKAYTLGTPVVSFDTSEIDYDSITVKWNTVMHNAEYLEKGSLSHGIKYTVKYNSKSYDITTSDMIDESSSIVEKSSDDYDIKCIDGKEFILKIKKNIAGFDYSGSGSKPVVSAKNAGAASELIVQASNDVTTKELSTKGSVFVKVLGPAEIALTTSKAAYDKQINVSWNAIEGAAGYVIRRICPRTKLG
ncbi:MAG: fibronectin type III domain-containing protein, partial [Spirochaetia bacterium]|nr:fibronectin type III domain-containing protein [Spirochaetia bacterium]